MRIQALSLQHAAGSLRSWHRDWGGVLTTTLAFVFLSYVAWMVFGQPSDEYKTLVTDLAQPLVSLGMTILAFRASRQHSLSSQNRRAWTLIAIASASGGLSEVPAVFTTASDPASRSSAS